MASPLPEWVAGFGLAVITPPPVLDPAPLSLVAAAAAEVLKRPLTPLGKNPPEVVIRSTVSEIENLLRRADFCQPHCYRSGK